MKKVFYVLRCGRLGGGDYFREAGLGASSFSGTLEGASQYNSVIEALGALQTRCKDSGTTWAVGSTQLVRVEEITTAPTKRRIEVPLGDKRQTGVAIKSTVCGGYFDPATRDFPDEIEQARVHRNMTEAIHAYKRGASLDNPEFVGIAEESTPGTTTYNETVLA